MEAFLLTSCWWWGRLAWQPQVGGPVPRLLGLFWNILERVSSRCVEHLFHLVSAWGVAQQLVHGDFGGGGSWVDRQVLEVGDHLLLPWQRARVLLELASKLAEERRASTSGVDVLLGVGTSHCLSGHHHLEVGGDRPLQLRPSLVQRSQASLEDG